MTNEKQREAWRIKKRRQRAQATGVKITDEYLKAPARPKRDVPMTDDELRQYWRDKKRAQREALPKKEPKQKRDKKPKKVGGVKTYEAGLIDEDAWSYLDTIDKTWRVYARESDNGWHSIRVAANKPMQNKASYWLGWNGSRISYSRDASVMQDGRPGLLEKVVSILSDNLGAAC